MVINCSGCYTLCSFHCPRSYFLFSRSSIACLARSSAIPSNINRDFHNCGTGSQTRVTAHPRLVRFISLYSFMFYSTVRRHMCPNYNVSVRYSATVPQHDRFYVIYPLPRTQIRRVLVTMCSFSGPTVHPSIGVTLQMSGGGQVVWLRISYITSAVGEGDVPSYP